MKKKRNIDRLEMLAFFNGLVFYAPVALLVRTHAGVTMAQFFVLQAVLSLTVFLFEIPTGMLTDRIGYKNTMVLAQVIVVLARGLMVIAYLTGSLGLFVVEAVAEGFAACFLSGTQDAYIYSVYQEAQYPVKMARVSNFGTAGFIVSTLLYAVLYRLGGILVLLVATVVSCGIGVFCAAGMMPEPQMAGHVTPTQEGDTRTMLQIFRNAPMRRMVFLAACFSVAFLLINFFYVEKLLACGIQEAWMSPIILVYSAIQMLAERLLDRIGNASRQRAMFWAILVAGGLMIAFAISFAPVLVVLVMVVLPLALSFPEYILNSMENAYIDECGLPGQRAAILSVANMAGNLMEIIFLLASAYIAALGTAACFLGAGVLLLIFGMGVCCAKEKEWG